MASVEKSDRAQSLTKGLSILQSFSAGQPRMTLTEVATTTGLNKATARRFLLSLLDLGFLRQDGRYFSLTPKVLTLGFNYLSTLPWWQFALPVMEQVARELQEACSAGVRSENELVFVARVPGPRVMSVNLGAGRPVPLHIAAMGRVLMSELSDAELDAYFATASLGRFTPVSLTDPEAIRATLRETRQTGYAIVDQELDVGFRSIAVAIRNHTGAAVASLGVSAHIEQRSVDEVKRDILPALRDAARMISVHLGG